MERILGEAAPTRQRNRVWSNPWAEGISWERQQRTAVCEIPRYVTEAGASDGVCSRYTTLRLWICAGCGAWLPEGMSSYCSPQCTQVNHATQTWLGQRLGARYATPV